MKWWVGLVGAAAGLGMLVVFAVVVVAATDGSDAARASDSAGDSAAEVESSWPTPSPSTTESASASASTEQTSTPDRESTSPSASTSSTDDGRAAEASVPEPAPTTKPAARRFLVVRAVDGDTLELGNGQTVRVIGIDTPERGECNYEAASQAMAGLVVGEAVTLTRVDEDTDRYGRILRYVDVGRLDPGLRLIEQGLAIARYDSRDGYGFHPREPRYIRADRSTPQRKCAPTPKPTPQAKPSAPSGGGGNCASGYSPCVPAYPPDVNCADVNGPISVSGPDPHGLDRDGDGVACE